jgi:predicted Rossmann fold flavoprotein
LSKDRSYDVCIVGAGPAGLMASVFASQQGASVCIVERNNNAGRKLLLTGGGRCNLTHAGTIDDFVKACHPYGNILKPSFYTLSPEQLLEFYHSRGLQTHTEPDGCVFPLNGSASNVRRILLDEVAAAGVSVLYGHRVRSVHKHLGRFVVQTEGGNVIASSLIIATGGVSWPQTGSSGDGYHVAETFGHAIISPVGILCPVICDEPWFAALQGTALPNVVIRVKTGKKTTPLSGAVVFTKKGMGGPAAFDVSRLLADVARCGQTMSASMDFCPERDNKELDQFLIDQCVENPKKAIAGIVSTLLPKRLAERLTTMVLKQEKITGAQLPKKARLQLVQLIKQMPLTFTACGDIEKATATRGGVNNKEVDFKTLQSRICPGLYFAGEVLDIDGPCGGYNLQIAFSTGALAGTKAAPVNRDTEN